MSASKPLKPSSQVIYRCQVEESYILMRWRGVTYSALTRVKRAKTAQEKARLEVGIGKETDKTPKPRESLGCRQTVKLIPVISEVG